MSEASDFLTEMGVRAFATRLRRFYEMLHQGVGEAYRETGVKFEPRWYGFLTLLRAREKIDIGEAAAVLGQSHVAVIQVVNVLEEERLVYRLPSVTDKRRREITLTAKGRALCADLDPFWRAVHQATQDLLEEAAPDFIKELDALEAALARKPLQERVREYATMSRKSMAS